MQGRRSQGPRAMQGGTLAHEPPWALREWSGGPPCPPAAGGGRAVSPPVSSLCRVTPNIHSRPPGSSSHSPLTAEDSEVTTRWPAGAGWGLGQCPVISLSRLALYPGPHDPSPTRTVGQTKPRPCWKWAGHLTAHVKPSPAGPCRCYSIQAGPGSNPQCGQCWGASMETPPCPCRSKAL